MVRQSISRRSEAGDIFEGNDRRGALSSLDAQHQGIRVEFLDRRCHVVAGRLEHNDLLSWTDCIGVLVRDSLPRCSVHEIITSASFCLTPILQSLILSLRGLAGQHSQS